MGGALAGLLLLPLTQDACVNKVKEAEVLQQVILYGSAGQQNATLRLELSESCVCQVLTVFKTMTLRE